MLRWHARPFGHHDEDDGDYDSLLADDSVTDIGGEDEAEEEIRESRPPVTPVRRLPVQVPVHKAGKPAVQPAGKTAAPSAARKVRKATVKSATKKAAPKKAAPKQAAVKKAAPKKAAVNKAAVTKPAKKAAPKKAAPKKAAPKKAK